MAKVLVAAIAPMYHPEIGRKERGQKFEMEQSDVQRHVDAKLVVQLTGFVEPEPSAPQIDVSTASLAVLKETWDVEMTPSEYLDKFPQGPHSDLALRIVELEAETTDSTS